MKNSLGIYIHFPFCVKKCNYCDFLSFPIKNEKTDLYLDALCGEIAFWEKQTTCPVDSVFFGGGTPSLLSGKQLGRIMDRLQSAFSLTRDCEITVEANPGTLTEENMKTYLACGVNRLSIGLQSMDDRILKQLGRIHTKDVFLQTYHQARKLGFWNINVDLMFSLPGLTENVWKKTLQEVTDLCPEHISFYGLILEEGTPFYEAFQKGLLKETDDAADRRQYWYTVDMLTRKGYEIYEISNGAKPGFSCRHNLKYWSLKEYLGLGLGAHSYLDHKRIENTSQMQIYQKWAEQDPDAEGYDYGAFKLREPAKQSRIFVHENTERKDMEEFMFLGLRKTAGISKTEFEQLFGVSAEAVYGKAIKKMKAKGLLKETEGHLLLTRNGVDISNYVLSEFLF